jgi:hypothetical protein
MIQIWRHHHSLLGRRMSLRVACPTCGHVFAIAEDRRQSIEECPRCKLTLRAGDNLLSEADSTRSANTVSISISPGLIAFGLLSIIVACIFVGVLDLQTDSSPSASSAAEQERPESSLELSNQDIPTFKNHELQELKDIEQDLRRRQYSSDPADRELSDIRQRLKPLSDKARSRIDAVNRGASEPGYPLEIRREAAYRTFLDQGYSPEEARLTVDAMEQKGLLPDPPRQ